MILMSITAITFILIVLFSKKRISLIEIYASTFSALYFQLIVDMFLHMKFQLYGYFKEGVMDWKTMGTIPIYASVNILFLNFFPFKKKLYTKITYILVWSGASVLYEWTALQTDFFYYNGWNLWYSAICYPLLFTILIYNLKLIRKIKTAS